MAISQHKYLGSIGKSHCYNNKQIALISSIGALVVFPNGEVLILIQERS